MNDDDDDDDAIIARRALARKKHARAVFAKYGLRGTELKASDRPLRFYADVF